MRCAKLLAAACLASLTACTFAPLALAPGAEKVRVTKVAADLVGCTPVGNIEIPRDANGFRSNSMRPADQMKNQAIGFGGNAAFVTEGSVSFPMTGVAYRCPEQARTAH